MLCWTVLVATLVDAFMCVALVSVKQLLDSISALRSVRSRI